MINENKIRDLFRVKLYTGYFSNWIPVWEWIFTNFQIYLSKFTLQNFFLEILILKLF